MTKRREYINQFLKEYVKNLFSISTMCEKGDAIKTHLGTPSRRLKMNGLLKYKVGCN